ncbi:MAG: aldehyde ferredoxin oxidoreductase [Bacteroidetes bacterium]|nr:MAG: aldehyde ferredoxin oxidoreductase [Bacteroidota bacterium]
MSDVRRRGYWRRIGVVDLSRESVKLLDPGESIYKRFLGGKGLGAKLLLDNSPPRASPLSPDNPIIFIVGPMEGLVVAGAARIGAQFKSPLTGFFGESYSGGYLGTEFAKAGFDAIIIRGESKKPVYIFVEDGSIEIRDAAHLWGLDAYETEKEIWREHGEIMPAVIGPAGENLVKFANIVHGLYMHKQKGLRGGFFGRTGGGAVMGSKKLKALVVRGSLRIEAGDPELLGRLREKIVKLAKEKLKGLSKYGTSGIMALTNSTGSLPSRYFIDGSFDGYDKIGPETYNSTVVKKHTTCYACAVRCGRHSVIEEDGEKIETHGPEYETLYAMGALTGVDDLNAIVKANELAGRLGFDTITGGNVVALAMYLGEKGRLRDEEVEFRFGNPEALVKSMELIAYRRGIGDILAEGAKIAAEKLGEPEAAVHAKGLEPPGYDPRALKGAALAYGVSVRGACHLRHIAYRPCLVGQHPFKPEVKVDRLSYEGHAEYVLEEEDFYALVDSLIICKFYTLPVIGPLLWEGLREVYRAATGVEASVSDLKLIGERINNLIRVFNLREGLKREDDKLSRRLYREALKKGESSGEIIDEEKYEEMLSKYYNLRGWTQEGRPTPEKLRELELTEYVE